MNKELTIIDDQEQDQEQEDLEFSRQQYYKLIENSNLLLDRLTELASDFESPRFFEVVSNAIKTNSDLTDRLVELHKSKKSLKEKNETTSTSSSKGNTTTNQLFVGSTSELQKMLYEMNNSSAEINVKINEKSIE
jgi:hypothetical protein